MDWLTFLSKVIGSLAWPAVVVGLFYFNRPQILGLLHFLKKVKVGGFEAEFGHVLREVNEAMASAEASSTQASSHKVASAAIAERERLVRLADHSPRAAVLEAWLPVEEAAMDLATTSADPSPKRMLGPFEILKRLDKHSLITPQQRQSYTKLRHLRNEVVHTSNATLPLDDVIEYIDLSLALAEQFRSAKN